MALPKRSVRGVLGQGVNVCEDQPNLINSSGLLLQNASGAWHLELSSHKHAYLTRRGPCLRLILKEFADDKSALRPTGFWVELDRQQVADFIFAAPDLLYTARRNDITNVSRLFLVPRKKCNVEPYLSIIWVNF